MKSNTTTQLKTTPAPWKWKFNSSIGNDVMTDADGQIIQSEGDKKLQEAAPDLLEACKAARSIFQKAGVPVSDLKKLAYILNVIEKAEGK